MHHNLCRFNIAPNKDQLCDAALDGLSGFVGAFLNFPAFACGFDGFKSLVLDLFRYFKGNVLARS